MSRPVVRWSGKARLSFMHYSSHGNNGCNTSAALAACHTLRDPPPSLAAAFCGVPADPLIHNLTKCISIGSGDCELDYYVGGAPAQGYMRALPLPQAGAAGAAGCRAAEGRKPGPIRGQASVREHAHSRTIARAARERPLALWLKMSWLSRRPLDHLRVWGPPPGSEHRPRSP